jgi:hypothetical protein
MASCTAPRVRGPKGLIRRPMLIRAWLFLPDRAILSLAGFFYELTQAGWRSGDPTGAHTSFHHAYQQATTMSADELRKWVIRTRSSRRAAAVTPAPAA